MRKFYLTIILAFTGLLLTGCVTTSEREQQSKDQIIATQAAAMSKSQKNKFCAKLKTNHTRYRNKILPIIWKNLNRQKNNKMTYKELKVTWLSVINLPEADAKLGEEFSFYKQKMQLNLRYGFLSKCAWMNQKAI